MWSVFRWQDDSILPTLILPLYELHLVKALYVKIVRDLSAETTSVWSSVILHRPHKEHHRSRGLAILSRVVVRLGRSRAGGSREEGSRRAGRRGTAAEPIVCGCAIANRACPCRPSLPLSHSPRLRRAPAQVRAGRERARQTETVAGLRGPMRDAAPRALRYADSALRVCGHRSLGPRPALTLAPRAVPRSAPRPFPRRNFPAHYYSFPSELVPSSVPA